MMGKHGPCPEDPTLGIDRKQENTTCSDLRLGWSRYQALMFTEHLLDAKDIFRPSPCSTQLVMDYGELCLIPLSCYR